MTFFGLFSGVVITLAVFSWIVTMDEARKYREKQVRAENLLSHVVRARDDLDGRIATASELLVEARSVQEKSQMEYVTLRKMNVAMQQLIEIYGKTY